MGQSQERDSLVKKKHQTFIFWCLVDGWTKSPKVSFFHTCNLCFKILRTQVYLHKGGGGGKGRQWAYKQGGAQARTAASSAPVPTSSSTCALPAVARVQ